MTKADRIIIHNSDTAEMVARLRNVLPGAEIRGCPKAKRSLAKAGFPIRKPPKGWFFWSTDWANILADMPISLTFLRKEAGPCWLPTASGMANLKANAGIRLNMRTSLRRLINYWPKANASLIACPLFSMATLWAAIWSSII